MSARNGDTSRFHRLRKQKIARRARTHELLKRLPQPSKAGDSRTRTVPERAGA
jgi:hypothetical protein